MPGRVQTTVLPDPEETSETTAGPEASPQPNTTTMARIPEPDLAASQPGVSPEDEAVVTEPEDRPVTEVREERESETAHRGETVAGPDAAEDISAPAVVDGEEVETNEQLEKKGEKKKGFFSRFFGV